MVRLDQLPPAPEAPSKTKSESKAKVTEKFVEREITLSLLNDKLNYIIDFLHQSKGQ